MSRYGVILIARRHIYGFHEGMETDDRKMFAPVFRGQTRSVEAQVCAVLGGYQAGATASRLADELLRLGYAVGLKVSVTKRVADLLESLERAQWVERIPDGRYRIVKANRTRTTPEI